MTGQTPEQTIGEVAAGAIEWINGRPITGAVLIFAVDDGEGGCWFSNVPPGQSLIVTRGLIEAFRDALISGTGEDPE